MLAVARWEDGANGQNRTADLLITNQLLYRLSYIGVKAANYAARRGATQPRAAVHR